MKRYIVVRDLQGGEFGMGRDYTVEEWVEQAIDWHDGDDYFDNKEHEKRFKQELLRDAKKHGDWYVLNYIAEMWQLEFDTKENVVANLQDQVSKNNIPTYDELKDECERYGLEVYEDILSPMEWNSCDRCGDLWESEQLFWEYADWGEESEELRAGLNGKYYPALCENCVSELVELGKKELEKS